MDYENVVNSLKTLKVELDEVFKKNKSNQDSQLSDWKGGRKNVSETNKKEAGVQEETEKDLPETEPVTEPVEESPEATAGTETTEETESAAEDDKESDKETKGKNSFFGKKKKDNKLEQQIEDLTDRLKRNMAEFDNFRKRTEKEKSSMYVIGAKDIIEKILPVVDNFERGLAQAPEDDPFAEGMQKIYKQFTTTMEGMGVEPIEAVGKEFNPDFHNAVMHVEDESVGENIVVEELQKGYTYKGFVVRHSMVKVAN